ncbi:MAG: hypothetical protein IPK65_08110 [Gammaproteobacteria bacterium]|nr:hypothetical protein [Gammaproteobacteria bacterium]
MNKTANISAVMLALVLGLAGCSGKDESMEEPQDTMENSADTMMEHTDEQSHDATMGEMPAEPAAPAEPAPAEGQ